LVKLSCYSSLYVWQNTSVCNIQRAFPYVEIIPFVIVNGLNVHVHS
jgi:hypothetical protein